MKRPAPLAKALFWQASPARFVISTSSGGGLPLRATRLAQHAAMGQRSSRFHARCPPPPQAWAPVRHRGGYSRKALMALGVAGMSMAGCGSYLYEQRSLMRLIPPVFAEGSPRDVEKEFSQETLEQAKKLFKEYDINGDGVISLGLVPLLRPSLCSTPKYHPTHHVHAEEFKEVFKKKGRNATIEELEHLFSIADLNSDHVIDINGVPILHAFSLLILMTPSYS